MRKEEYILQQKMVIDIIHTANKLDHKISLFLKDFNITHAQFNILRMLENSHPDKLCVGEIKRKILFPNSDITRLIDRLVIKKLVGRQVAENNRRQVNIFLTRAGQDTLIKIIPRLTLVLKNFYASKITTKSAETTIEALSNIRNAID